MGDDLKIFIEKALNEYMDCEASSPEDYYKADGDIPAQDIMTAHHDYMWDKWVEFRDKNKNREPQKYTHIVTITGKDMNTQEFENALSRDGSFYLEDSIIYQVDYEETEGYGQHNNLTITYEKRKE